MEPFYLSNPDNIDLACELTGLAVDEIESIVGRFTNRSQWAGQLRGEIAFTNDGNVMIRNHFGKKVLWIKE